MLPIESRPSVISRTSLPRPLISAIPPALSATGPYASTVIVTPTVASIPIAAIAIPYRPNSGMNPPALLAECPSIMKWLAPKIPKQIRMIGMNVDIIPTDNPAIAFVAGPVLDICPM